RSSRHPSTETVVTDGRCAPDRSLAAATTNAIVFTISQSWKASCKGSAARVKRVKVLLELDEEYRWIALS
ncbi:hypothetical protein, partial [Pseudomonas sp.]|uniref:hypothetical protein n=1 Tax=Pseudomonas sp. TaxID=306 RepID=UPI003BB050A8